MATLSVNVDHVATLRQARGGIEPEPVTAAAIAELAGAEGIITHLREDRRHIQDRDVRLLRQTIQTRMNLEMAATDEMIAIARDIKPEMCTLVPEKREELTTEGGLDVVSQTGHIRDAIKSLHEAGILVSLFIDAQDIQIRTARDVSADFVELHTGHYANAVGLAEVEKNFIKIAEGVKKANELDLRVNVGHGLNYVNVRRFKGLPGIQDFSIGHCIISRAVLVGLDRAVREMAELVREL